MQSVRFYTVDLTRIEGRGEFKCPKCGAKISPDDKSEKTYTVSEPVMREDCLEKVILQCNKCGSQIHITGFNNLNKMQY